MAARLVAARLVAARLATIILAAFALTTASAIELQAQSSSDRAALDSLRQALAVTSNEFPDLARISVDSFTVGGRTIAANEIATGNVGVRSGNLDVYGTVHGDAIVMNGDIVVHDGGSITGNALAIRGRVRGAGGNIDGAMYTLGGELGASQAGVEAVTPVAATWRALSLTLGTFAILFFIGIGVLIFAGSNLEGVLESLQGRLPRAFLVGLAGQLAIAPVLLLIIVGLAISILGILLIPFAIVAYAIAIAGMMTLGFLAVARLAGEGWFQSFGKRALTPRGATLRALAVGVAIFGLIWLIVAMLTWSPVAGGVLRGVAVVVTWISVTAGFGAVILSRGGTRRAEQPAAVLPPAAEAGWLTPTPITGVAAARRPVRTGSAQ